ncbi:hypothetical protein ETAA8_39560 [Anatilimnocola aggregata]|uniref:Tetratricopeptide repeat protein n=1 Tax=Anatilimnocola aggregata TaxID=2528021 RepID=A0A517YF73_9BACT|nr:hypothetical protein [Anatilimnocola aggregata]QDU28851.1 hypothetical protein ETAA8_39560 [Anatilimnocola aggregata]
MNHQPVDDLVDRAIASAIDWAATNGEPPRHFFILALYTKTPAQTELIELIQAFVSSGPSEQTTLRTIIEQKLDCFIRKGPGDHPCPEWAVATMRGLWMFATNDFEESVSCDRDALEIVQGTNSWMEAVSNFNISEHYLRVEGEYAEALRYVTNAIVIDPRNQGFWSNYAIASLLEGSEKHRAMGLKVLRDLPAFANDGTLDTVWVTLLELEPEYADMLSTELELVPRLKNWLDKTRGSNTPL